MKQITIQESFTLWNEQHWTQRAQHTAQVCSRMTHVHSVVVACSYAKLVLWSSSVSAVQWVQISQMRKNERFISWSQSQCYFRCEFRKFEKQKSVILFFRSVLFCSTCQLFSVWFSTLLKCNNLSFHTHSSQSDLSRSVCQMDCRSVCACLRACVRVHMPLSWIYKSYRTKLMASFYVLVFHNFILFFEKIC